MSSNNLRVTELDFDTIKNNLKTFLRTQSEFQDYDFEGSGLSVLLDILAYNTHYNAYYLNMVANESFLDTAILRDSVVSHAKTLGYTPYSVRAARAVVNFYVESYTQGTEELVLPRGFSFKSELVDNMTYNFVTIEDASVTKSNTTFIFENLPIYQGQIVDYSFTYSEVTNPKAIFEIPEDNIDSTTIKVYVTDSSTNTSMKVYTLADELPSIDGTSEVFFLQEGRNTKYQIYFGDDVLGKKLNNGAVVTVSYLVTNGEVANKLTKFRIGQTLNPYTAFEVQTVSPSAGGSSRETVDEIKYYAPMQFTSQRRLVTIRDYESFIKRNYPNVDSISIWGGEDESPPVYGKVFISLKPKEGYFLSESEKNRIIEEIINPNCVLTIKSEIRDPEFLFLNFDVLIKYDEKKLVTNRENLRVGVKNAIINYKNLYLNRFNILFSTSKLQDFIDNVDSNSILGSQVIIRAQRRLDPILGRKNNYTINFNFPLLQGNPNNKLTSSQFVVLDGFGVQRSVIIEEVPKSITGINSIEVLNPGSNYTSEPTVTITGDGIGATARAVVVNNRIQRIEVITPGIDYTRATVTITGGGGYGASARAIADTKIGTLRTVYYTSTFERRVVNSNAGLIDYSTGIVNINDLTVISVNTIDGLIRFTCGIQNLLIESNKNTILTVDDDDASAIIVNLEEV